MPEDALVSCGKVYNRFFLPVNSYLRAEQRKNTISAVKGHVALSAFFEGQKGCSNPRFGSILKTLYRWKENKSHESLAEQTDP